jgi:hypothetical protein
MFRLLKRPFTTKLCLECINFKENKCLKTITSHNIVLGEITHDSAINARNTICGVEEPKFFESNLINMENDLNEKKNSYNNIKFFGFYNGGGLLLNMAFVYNYAYLLNDTLMWGLLSGIQLGVQFNILDELVEKNILIKKLNDNITTIKNFKI